MMNRVKPKNYAYIVIFLPNTIDTVDKAWTYLESHSNDSSCTIPFYAGKGNYPSKIFSVEDYHSIRKNSTIYEYIKETKMRAYQLIAIHMDSEPTSALQEAIFQKIGFLSNTRQPRPNSLNYKIINQRAELVTWESLSKDDSNKAFDLGMQRHPILCLDRNCTTTHQNQGEFSFGKFHRNEVTLVPFEYEKYL